MNSPSEKSEPEKQQPAQDETAAERADRAAIDLPADQEHGVEADQAKRISEEGNVAKATIDGALSGF